MIEFQVMKYKRNLATIYNITINASGPLLLTLLLADFLTGFSTDFCHVLRASLLGTWLCLWFTWHTGTDSSCLNFCHLLYNMSFSDSIFSFFTAILEQLISYSVQSNTSIWKFDTSNCLAPSLKSISYYLSFGLCTQW